jgi:hypothetical protein
MRKIFVTLMLFTLINPLFAVMEYSKELQNMYRSTYKAMQVPTPDNDTIFNYAMTLTYMGKIQSAGKYLKLIDSKDEAYKYKVLERLTKKEEKNPDQDWQFNMKMGLVYYFLFEEAHGKILLYTRRISRGKRDNNKEKITVNRERRRKMWPIKDKYFAKSSHYFDKVARKKPVTSMNAWGYAYQAVLNAVNEDWKISKMFCEKALDIEPDAYALRAAYMEALRQTGNYFGAINEMRIAYAKKDQQEEYERKIFGRVAE